MTVPMIRAKVINIAACVYHEMKKRKKQVGSPDILGLAQIPPSLPGPFFMSNPSNSTMKIKGLLGTSLLDYPGKISSIVFTGGCNLNVGTATALI